MRFSRMITVVGVHAEGELNEVITGGVLDVAGKTMFDKMRWLEREGDDLRQFLLQEPRGKVTQCVNLVLPATTAEVDSASSSWSRITTCRCRARTRSAL